MTGGPPKGWADTTLGEVVGQPRPKAAPTDHPDLPFVGMDHIASDGMALLGTGKFGDMKSNGGMFWDGDVLYGRMRPYLNKVYRARFAGACSAEFIVFPERAEIDSDFLAYLLHDRKFVNFASSFSSGDRPRVDLGDISAYAFALPPRAEQTRIASKIDELFSGIDEGERALERVEMLLERYQRSVLRAAVTGELTRDWREKNKDELASSEDLLAHILAARRTVWEKAEVKKMHGKGITPVNGEWKRKYEEPSLPEITDLPELPDGWTWVTLDCIAECLDYAREPVSAKVRESRPGVIPYYGANGQVGTIDRHLFDEPLVLVVEDETFTGRTKPFSYKIEGKSWVNNHAHVLRPTTAVDVDFLNAILMRYPFIPLTTGTTARRKLTQKALMSAPLAVPGREEQSEIVSRLQAQISIVEPTERDSQTALKTAKGLGESILRKAFSGHLVSQRFDDEPAIHILERIRAQRKMNHEVANRGRKKTRTL